MVSATISSTEGHEKEYYSSVMCSSNMLYLDGTKNHDPYSYIEKNMISVEAAKGFKWNIQDD